MVALPYYVGIGGLLRTAPALVAAVFAAVRRSEYVVLRVPGAVTSVAAIACRVLRRSYAVDVVGDAADAVDGGALGRCGRVLSPVVKGHVRWVVGHAGAARYVTAHALQARYPSPIGVPAVGVSDVRIDEVANTGSRDWSGPPFRLVTVGTMEATYKGQDDLIRAAAKLRADGVDVSVDLVGGGRLEERNQALARELGVAERVRFLGTVSDRAALTRILDTSHLFVLASRQEGLPRALVEAMARGLPAVATRVGGVPELLDPACLVAPDDPDALATAIRELLADPQRWRQESARNLSTAREYHRDVLAARFGEWIARIPAARSAPDMAERSPAAAAPVQGRI
ncbi:glycosyltransferase family 4 protein [Sporichthya sp.]|uniref:glycosyltransferase family 4 protein n=1 Tax=Sporichthya sp. TaxID=65475 RepID=UPI00178F7CA6|nr:glycosyltransferase family 4 protein [Sporichthya sp.]MBA3741938.1 glycosyltransferase family 4 protein [Sporichthya sp.]